MPVTSDKNKNFRFVCNVLESIGFDSSSIYYIKNFDDCIDDMDTISIQNEYFIYPNLDKTGWFLDGTKYHHGDRETPPETEQFNIGYFKFLKDVLLELAKIKVQQAINDTWENIYMDYED